ncbi:MAG TPA: phosphate ABC transporter permease subunit PstC [Streptosporangiaceae bacterium]|nr:phosphate ABC transporter permease subunit PstC [Streptosporangiaceae bacterium]
MAATAPTAQPDGGAGSPPPRRLGAALREFVRSGAPIRWLGRVGAVVPLLALALILVLLIDRAIPAIQFSGLKFLTGTTFNFGSQYGTPVTSQGIVHQPGEVFGALPEILGTLVTSAIALIIAVPVSIGAAMVIVERLPRQLASYVGLFLELLAGIPSVIVGLWGALTFGPFIAHDIAPLIADTLGKVPGLQGFFGGETGNGQGLLTSGLVLAVMIIPIIAATARDLIRGVPILPREGAVALGMSDWETARRVTLPWVGAGLIGAAVLGLARALGETIAVAMVCGVALGQLPTNLYASMVTIAANIVQNLNTAITDPLDIRAFAELALVLMVITLATNVLARLMVRRVSGTALPVGRGL